MPLNPTTPDQGKAPWYWPEPWFTLSACAATFVPWIVLQLIWKAINSG